MEPKPQLCPDIACDAPSCAQAAEPPDGAERESCGPVGDLAPGGSDGGGAWPADGVETRQGVPWEPVGETPLMTAAWWLTTLPLTALEAIEAPGAMPATEAMGVEGPGVAGLPGAAPLATGSKLAGMLGRDPASCPGSAIGSAIKATVEGTCRTRDEAAMG